MEIDYSYSNTNSKSPDNSYVPRDIATPPGNLKPGANIAYPTIVIEVGHRHERWDKLKRDARNKASAASTTIQVVIGIKLFTSHFRMFWGCRSPTGRGMNIQDTTPKLDARTPTNLIFTISKALVFFGVPAHLLPVSPTPNLDLPIEILRVAVRRFF